MYNVLLTMKDVYAKERELDRDDNVCLRVCVCVCSHAQCVCEHTFLHECVCVCMCVCSQWTLTVPAGQSLVPVENKVEEFDRHPKFNDRLLRLLICLLKVSTNI